MVAKLVLSSGLLRDMLCSCRIFRGPAGDFKHHDRQCRIARMAAKQGRAIVDPQTNWVTIAR